MNPLGVEGSGPRLLPRSLDRAATAGASGGRGFAELLPERLPRGLLDPAGGLAAGPDMAEGTVRFIDGTLFGVAVTRLDMVDPTARLGTDSAAPVATAPSIPEGNFAASETPPAVETIATRSPSAASRSAPDALACATAIGLPGGVNQTGTADNFGYVGAKHASTELVLTRSSETGGAARLVGTWPHQASLATQRSATEPQARSTSQASPPGAFERARFVDQLRPIHVVASLNGSVVQITARLSKVGETDEARFARSAIAAVVAEGFEIGALRVDGVVRGPAGRKS